MAPAVRRLLALCLAILVAVPTATLMAAGGLAEDDGGAGVTSPTPVGRGLGLDDMAPNTIVLDPTQDRFQSLLPWPTNRTLYSMRWRPGGDYGLVVGSGGTLLRWTGSQVEHINTGTEEGLFDLEWKSDGSQAIIAGNHSTVLVWDAVVEDLTQLPITGVQRMSGVCWTPSGGALLVGDGGFVGFWNGSALLRIDAGFSGYLYRVAWRPGADYAAAVGDNGVVLEVNETSLVRRVDLTVNWMLWRIAWAPGGAYALVVGAKFPTPIKTLLAARYNASGTFDELGASMPSWVGLRGVEFARGAEEAIVVGDNSTALRWNGNALTAIPAPDDRTLYGVGWEGDGAHALAMGNRGLVLRWDGSAWGYRSYDPGDYLSSIAWRPQGDYGLVVGRTGYMARVSTHGSSRVDSGVVTDLDDVDWSSDGSYALACGAGGRVLRYEHSTGAVTSIRTGLRELRGVAIQPGHETALAVGDEGQVWEYTGGIWIDRKNADVWQNLWDVAWRPDGAFAIIVGVTGVALNFTGGMTAQFFNPPTNGYNNLYSVTWNKAGTAAMVVGTPILSFGDNKWYDGIEVYDNIGWQLVASHANVSFRGCAFTADGEVGLAFGEPDIIVKFSTRVGDAIRSPFRNFFTVLQRACMHPSGRTVYFCGGWGYAYRMDVGEFANRAPILAIVSPASGTHFDVGEQFYLDATGTFDPDDDPLTITWVSNASGVLGTGIRPRVAIDLAGWHRVTCYADDGKGHNVSAHVLLSIDVPNYAPVPVIASPLEGAAYTTDDDIVFDAEGTRDANGDNLTYQWVSALSGDIGYEKRVVARLGAGAHLVLLWVDDGLGGRAAAMVNITVTLANRPPVVYVTSPIEGARIAPGTEVELNASYSNDPDGDALVYTWSSSRDGGLGTGVVLRTVLSEGAHLVSVTVDDGHGHLVNVGVNVSVVRPPDLSPVVTVTSPANNSQLEGVVTITGTALDAEGPVATVLVSVGGPDDWLSAVGTEAWSFQWDTRRMTDGLYQVWVEASDGERSARVWVQYVVRNPEPPNQSPTVTLGTFVPAKLRGSLLLEGTATDPEGVLSRVQVRIDADPWVDASGTSSWSYYLDTRQYDDGPHTVSVRAFDGKAYSDEVTRQFIIDNGGADGGDGGGGAMLWLVVIIIVVVVVAVVVALALRARRR